MHRSAIGGEYARRSPQCEGVSPIPVGMAIPSDEESFPLPDTNHTLELIAITVLVGELGLFPNFEGGAYGEHGSLESLIASFCQYSVLTETIDYIGLYRSCHEPVAIQVLLGAGRGWDSTPTLGEKCSVRGCVLNPRKSVILDMLCLMKPLRYLAQFMSQSP